MVQPSSVLHTDVLIAGGGFAGLSLAIALYYLRMAYRRMFAGNDGNLAGAAA